MSDKKNGYIGQISNNASQIVNAPNAKKGNRGKSSAVKGVDLRSGK